MRKALPGLAMFVIGIAVGLFVLRGTGRAGMDQARRNALTILDRQPAPSNIGNNPLVAAAERIEPAVVNIDTAGVKTESGYDVTVTATALAKDLALFPDRLDAAARVDSSLITLSAGEHHTFHVTGATAPKQIAVPVLRSANDLVRAY